MKMPWIITEFETKEGNVVDAYGDEGFTINNLQSCSMMLRHEHFNKDTYDRIWLFSRPPEKPLLSVLVELFQTVFSADDLAKRVAFYEEHIKGFRMPRGQNFSNSLLEPKNDGFHEHKCFPNRDGRFCKRVVHFFRGSHRCILLSYSFDEIEDISSSFFAFARDNMTFNDVPFDFPFLHEYSS